jgi:Zn-dependent M16 (insulinase) family peptidase
MLGRTYKNFLVTKHLPIDELQSTLIELTHKPTGAQVLYIANSDPENLFSLSFQTLPYNSNGVAHILEHTVLCGSTKYPIKDPFFSMTRRSLNTFMNAMTGQDFTCYPASSQVEKDFYNLLEVYLDAVFHPELKLLSFLQEGHRLEFAEPKNPESQLQYQGVVYNEMKGDMTSSDSRLWKALCKHLTPDLTYAHNSGGDPEEIPSLTHEKLIEFHQTFYHPSRCLFFFYGNLPLEKHLDFLEKKALSGVKKLEPLPPLPLQHRFTHPVIAFDSYPIAASESLEKKTQIAFSWLTLPLANQADLLALSLLETLLMDTDASPLKMALLQSKLCTQASSLIDLEMSEVPWTIICKGCEAKDANSLKKVIFDTLREVISKPFSQKHIDAAIHQLEFQRMEIGGEGVPFGLTLFMRAAPIKQHGSEAEQGLFIHSLFEKLRSSLKNPHYLTDLLQKWILDNPHHVQLTLQADPELTAKEAKEELRSLAKIRASLTKEDEKKIIDQSIELATYQEQIENQSLDCLPKVTLKDVPLHGRDFPLTKEKKNNLEIFHHNCFTNKILYADLIFDLPAIKTEDLSLLSLLARFLPELGCKGRSYREMLEMQQAYTGGIQASLSLHPTQMDPNIYKPTFSIRGKALFRNSEKLLDLFIDLVSSADLTDQNRLKELLAQHITSLENRLVKNAINYAIQTSLSGFSVASFINDQWNGLPYYNRVKKWGRNLKELIDELQRLQKMVLCSPSPELVLGCDDELYQSLQKNQFFNLSSRLPQEKHNPWKGDYLLPNISSQARFIASPVAFTALGMRTVSYKADDSPFLLLGAELLQNCVLHKEIREKGGAYGSEAVYTPTTGNFYFYSYRDPQLAKTVDTFHKSLEKIGHLKFTEQQLQEAKLGVIQTIDAPVPPSSRAMAAYSWQRSGRSLELREDYRRKILSASKQDVAHAIGEKIIPLKKTLVTFLDQGLFEKEKKKMKEPLVILPVEE